MPDLYTVIFTPEAKLAIQARAEYIELQSSPITSERYVIGLYEFCESLSAFPHRSIRRDDLFPNLHITNYLGTAVVAYEVDEDARIIRILDIFHSSQNYERFFTS